MFSLFLSATLASASGVPLDQTAEACTAERIRPFVSPAGIRQNWPRTEVLPARLVEDLGTLLSDQGNYDDGYSHWLVLDHAKSAAYVVQRGGYAGIQTVFGPLPIASCAPVPPNNSFKPRSLRGRGVVR